MTHVTHYLARALQTAGPCAETTEGHGTDDLDGVRGVRTGATAALSRYRSRNWCGWSSLLLLE